MLLALLAVLAASPAGALRPQPSLQRGVHGAPHTIRNSPLTDDVLAHVDFALDALQKRLKGQRLTVDEARRLASSLDTIVHDARAVQTATGVSPLLEVAHPAVVGPPPVSTPAALADRDVSGIGNPLGVRPDLPATKTLIAEGKKTHQQLGKIMTNTWVRALSTPPSLSCSLSIVLLRM